MNSDIFFEEEIKQLEQKKLKRRLRPVEGSQGPRIVIEGKEVLNFCSNNYLGLADDVRLKKAAKESIDAEGFGAGASRLICGNMSSHRRLEKAIAEFKDTERALVFNTGYMANVGIISGLFGRGDIIFSDKLNHASIVDGIILSRCDFKRYAHKDMGNLEELLKASAKFKKRCIVTDSVFSMDGDIAPLPEIVELAEKYNCLVMIDEAHAFGVMGKRGKGLAEHFNLGSKIDIQMGTLSKAAGCFGAYVAGKEPQIDFLVNKARSFIYTTALPPAIAAAGVKAIEIIQSEPKRRETLWQNTNYLLSGIKKLGFDSLDSQSPIIPIVVKKEEVALEFSKALFEKGIFAVAIRPPTVPLDTSRLRISVMATHTKNDIDYLLKNLKEIGKQLCLI